MFLYLLLLITSHFVFLDPPPATIAFSSAKPGEATVIRVTGVNREQLTAFVKTKPNDEAWQKLLHISVAKDAAESKGPSSSPLLGSFRYVHDEGAIVFEPRLPLAPGTTYRVAYDPNALTGKTAETILVRLLSLPKLESTPAIVTSINPSNDEWPENSLRVYLNFSAPMARGNVYEHIRLLRDDGTVVPKPFLELDEELWNPDSTRFTLLFDPGRIKNGLLSKEEAGANLVAGQWYTIEIGRNWKDADGHSRTEPFRKRFKATKFDAAPIDPEKWTLTAPEPGSRSAFQATFSKPLDRALLHRMISVEGPNAKPVEGWVTLSERETQWSFVPKENWVSGRYRLVIDTRLEDPCGNRVGSPFEIDVFRSPTRRLETKTVERTFTVK